MNVLNVYLNVKHVIMDFIVLNVKVLDILYHQIVIKNVFNVKVICIMTQLTVFIVLQNVQNVQMV
jgi:hypothetical protein